MKFIYLLVASNFKTIKPVHFKLLVVTGFFFPFYCFWIFLFLFKKKIEHSSM